MLLLERLLAGILFDEVDGIAIGDRATLQRAAGDIPAACLGGHDRGLAVVEILGLHHVALAARDVARLRVCRTTRLRRPQTAVLLDESGDIGRLYGAKTTPHMYVIDSAGTLVYMGGIDSIPTTDQDDIQRATNYVDAALSALSSGQPVKEAVTRPYGCSVKY